MKRRWLAAALGCAAWTGASAQPADPLLEGFLHPPASARPRAWWHWLNGNITLDGIDKDLAWMKRVGLGGVQAFDASLGTPQIVAERLPYMTPAWKAAFAHAARTADDLDLELAIASSPGWSETGGPWVLPADAMKKLVWSETAVEGGRPVTARLPALPRVTGPYGRTPYVDPVPLAGLAPPPAPPTAGRTIAVLAYPVPDDPVPAMPVVTDAAGHALDGTPLLDDREDTSVALRPGAGGQPAELLFAYAHATEVRSFTLFVPHAVPPFGAPAFQPRLEAEVGGDWRTIATVPVANVPTTLAFAPIRASRFRLRFLPTAPASPDLVPAPGAIVGGIFPEAAPDAALTVATARLSADARVDRFEAKAGFQAVPDYYALSTDADEAMAPPPSRVVDLSDRLRADGTLAWTPPHGRWRIVRLGWSLIGTTNHPAAPEATGLEVDKYDGAAVRRYFNRYLDAYRGTLGPAGGVRALVTDSIEAGDANWTPRLLDRFAALRGYDARPWLPVLTGAVIGSRAQSDAFLYDYRRTLAELLAREHYGTIAAVAKEQGLTLYGEALENGRPQLGDDLAMRAHATVPMAAMWAFPPGGAARTTSIGDIRGAASVAHVYGQNLVAAESFTSAFSPWSYAPADLKPVADLEFALGVNRPVIHTSPLSPPDDKEPGLSLAVFGQYFNRHETWSGMAGPWIDYLARTSFLLQQGRAVADVAWFAGEEAPLTALFANAPPADLPQGHGFDFADADMLADALSVDGRDLVSPAGARYRLLFLGGTSRRMTLPTLRRIAALAEAGATVVGEAPLASPSLADDPGEVARLVRRLWAGGAVTRVGRGQVIAGHDLGGALARLKVGLDVDWNGGLADGLLFQHRTLAGADIYFLCNGGKTPLTGQAGFRIKEAAPALWDADTGTATPLGHRAEGDRTIVPLTLTPGSSALIVFRPAGRRIEEAAPIRPVATVAAVAGPWQVGFQPGRGAPIGLVMKELTPLDASSDPGIRYFSGVTTYSTHFAAPHGLPQGGRMLLDLGRVGDVAEVRVNGQPVGTAWHAPYRVDVGAVLRPGDNRLDVRVANLWVNRLIGDVQPSARKIGFVAAPTYRSDAPLRPAGLIGPVRLMVDGEATR